MSTTQMPAASGRLKSGTEMIFNGNQVFVEHDDCKGNVNVCDSKERGLEDTYFVILKSDLTPILRVRSSIVVKAKVLTKEQVAFKADLNVFFANQALVFPELCENCGTPLDAFTMWDRRCMTGHILEKNDNAFPEVATHPQNKIFIGTRNCTCHNSWDKKGAAYRASMPVYQLALTRFKEFAPQLSEKKLIKAYTYLNITP
jgi:hypothetical protein